MALSPSGSSRTATCHDGSGQEGLSLAAALSVCSLGYSTLEEPLYFLFCAHRITSLRSADVLFEVRDLASRCKPFVPVKKTKSSHRRKSTDVEEDLPNALDHDVVAPEVDELRAGSFLVLPLLILFACKRFIKKSFAIDDGKMKSFSPTDPSAAHTKAIEHPILIEAVVSAFAPFEVHRRTIPSCQSFLNLYRELKKQIAEEEDEFVGVPKATKRKEETRCRKKRASYDDSTDYRPPGQRRTITKRKSEGPLHHPKRQHRKTSLD
eukprot:TRINITY_DN5235_c0_g1_i1.p1 TRINITY_DN5235_c0_g1~~TRINITY_DN5235_c0_g1_i1.p1  ORF type:complete len:278 (+),score=63.54 TRINITY_DN5235_c0_g1_i1:41-835(+)